MNYMVSSISAVENIADLLESAHRIDNSFLVALLKEANLNAENFHIYQNYKHDAALSYGRTVAYEGRNFIIYVMSWAPGDFTAIHSHGYSDWGSVVFFSDTNHNLYHADGHKISLAEKSIIPKGSIVPVNGNLVHAMGNLTDRPFITLHIYGSHQALSNANDFSLVYEIEKKQIRTTNGSAYINISEENCKKTDHGLVTNVETLVDYLQIILPYYKRNKLNSAIKKIEDYLIDPESYFI
jgi:predicted metal-dependent enzyme (double-stranded beta helix superfamily)